MGFKKQSSWIRITILAFLLVIALLISYILYDKGKWGFSLTPILTTTTVPSMQFDDLQAFWLNKRSCISPCWIGIVPGETSSDEALTLLRNNPMISDVTQHEDNVSHEIDWKWSFAPSKGGRLFYDMSDPSKTVYLIYPGIGCCLTLGDIIKTYGSPDYVWVQKIENFENLPTPNQAYSYNFIWLHNGISVDVNQIGVMISPDLLVWEPTLFQPSLTGYFKYKGSVGAFLKPWQGYSDFSLYLVP